MHEINVALEYVERKKADRLKKNKIRRRQVRSAHFSDSLPSDSSVVDPFVINNNCFTNSLTLFEKEASSNISIPSSANDSIERNPSVNLNLSSSPCKYLNFHDVCSPKETLDLFLHPYTDVNCFTFAKDRARFIRKSNTSKLHADHLIKLIQSSLPRPNNLPKTYSGLLELLSGTEIFPLLSHLATNRFEPELILFFL
jgi:hypothetical protein